MKTMMRTIICCVVICIDFTSCTSDGHNKELAIPSQEAVKKPKLSESEVAKMLDNVASPVETAALLKKIGLPFSKKHLANTVYADDYMGNSKRAFGIGIYGADLGYINMYNKNSCVLDYISAIKMLADALDVGQFFDFATLKRLATNNTNIDSLMFISLHSFNKIDAYLYENNRGNLSALMITGVWIEGLYLATQVAKETKNKEIIEKIGDQKVILNNLILVLETHKKDKFACALLKDIRTLANIYNQITITVEPGEPRIVVENGRQIIEQTEKSIIKMTDAQLNDIIETIAMLRNKTIQA